jgi:hypothetical protein
MTAVTLAQTRSRLALRRRMSLAAVLAVLGGALALAATFAIGGGAGDRHDSASRTFAATDGSFSISYPKGWRAQPAEAVGASALIARADGRGMLVVRERGPVEGSLETLGRSVGPELQRRFKDFKPVGARIVRLSTGPALSYTFVRARSGMAQGLVVAPAGGRTYTIETVARGDAPDVAKQLGGIVRSFRK